MGRYIIDKEVLASTLRKYRNTHNLTQEELAQRLGIPPMTLYRWENARVTNISPLALQVLLTQGIVDRAQIEETVD